MKINKIFSIVMLLFIMTAYQNCGSSLLPGQSIDGFQSNGGGYSGLHTVIHENDPANNQIPNEDSLIDINNGMCTGKIMTYHLVSEACQPTGFNETDFNELLASNEFTLNDNPVDLPTTDQDICKDFVSEYVMVIDACESTIRQVMRSDVGYVGNGTTVTIDGLIYKSFGIFKIY